MNLHNVCARGLQLNGMATDEPVVVPESGEHVVTGTVYSSDDHMTQVAVGVVRIDGAPVARCCSEMDGFRLRKRESHLVAYTMRLPRLPGRYVARSHAMDPEGMRMFDHVELRFDVAGSARETGFVRLKHEWS